MLKKQIKEAVKEVIGDKDKILSLKDEYMKVKEELEELKLKEKIELRDIEHMIKIKQEKLAIEGEKKQIAMEREYQVKEMNLRNNQYTKIMDMLEKGHVTCKYGN